MREKDVKILAENGLLNDCQIRQVDSNEQQYHLVFFIGDDNTEVIVEDYRVRGKPRTFKTLDSAVKQAEGMGFKFDKIVFTKQ